MIEKTELKAHLSTLSDKMEALKNMPSNEHLVKEVLKLIEETTKEIKQFDTHKKFQQNPVVEERIKQAIAFYQKSPDIQQAVKELRIHRFWEILEEFGRQVGSLNKIKRGERVEKVDYDQL